MSPRIRLIIGFLTVFSPALLAQSDGTIRGIVIDRETREPIPDADVSLGTTNQGTTSDSLGRFVLAVSTQQRHILIISHVGYEKEVSQIYLDKDNEVNVTIAMRQKAMVLPGVTVTERSAEAIQDELATCVIRQDYIQESGAQGLDQVISRRFPLIGLPYVLYVDEMRMEPSFLRTLDPRTVNKITIWRVPWQPMVYRVQSTERYVIAVKLK